MAEESAKPTFDPVGDISGVLAGVFASKHSSADHPKIYHPDKFTRFVDEVGEYGVSRAGFLIVLFVILLGIASALMHEFLLLVWSWIFATAPLWLPAALITSLWKVWVWYVRALFIASRKTVLLEMKFPREIVKSPRAMEAALAGFWVTTGETTFIDRYWDGKMRTWFSFEMAAFDGEVHFYIWCWEEFRPLVEANIYAQYPEIELVEAEDYSLKFQYDPKVWDLFGNNMIMEKESPGISGRAHPFQGIYPVRSYIDFEMDTDLKEEYKTDPMVQMVELLGRLEKSEQGWVQIIFRSGSAQNPFAKAALDEVEKLRLESSTFRAHLTPEQEKTARARGTWRQTEQIMAIERHMGKRHFDAGIRIFYAAKHEDYSGENRNAIRWIFVPFSSFFLNKMRPKRWHGEFDYPWQDFHGIRWILCSRRYLDAWRRRSYFFAPWISPQLTLSAESLASFFHPPSRAVQTPGLHRIAATKAPAPPNLPT